MKDINNPMGEMGNLEELYRNTYTDIWNRRYKEIRCERYWEI
jgi:hypothetical protein